jgi:hypothetical protein
MEANFNATNKIIYGRRMMNTVRKYKLMPEEIFSEKNHLADDGTLAKELFYNVVRQTRVPAGITAVDADDCYDRITHPIASLVFQALGLPKEARVSMCSTIQNMKFSLQTGFGNLTEVVGATWDIKTQGMCQGNGATGASWTVTSIAMINAHKKKGHGIWLITPTTKKKLHLAGLLFVDNTDLKHLNMTKTETTMEALAALQGAVMNWGRLLITSGGALKPAKCFYHLISFQWMANGTWRYDANHENPDFQIRVPLGNSELAPIEHLSVDSPTKMLGLMTCPSGCSNGAFAQMTEKAQGWVARTFGGNLNCRHIWFLLGCQLSPMVFFSIGCNMAPFDSRVECLQRQWWEILPCKRRPADSATPPLANGFRFLWHRSSPPRSGMFRGTNGETADSLRQQIWHWHLHADVYGNVCH